jgi:trigger factor
VVKPLEGNVTMKLLSFDKNGNSAHVKIFIDAAEFNDKLNNVWNKQKKWFNIPGFRKGKAPRGVIENEYGHDVFHSSALAMMYPKMVDMIIDETKEKIIFMKEEIYMAISQDAKPVEVKEENNGVTTEFEVAMYPDVDINYENMEVEIEPKKVATDEQVNSQKSMVQKQAGKKSLEKVDKVQKGDFVRLNLKSILPLDATEEDKKQFKQFENVNGVKMVVDDASPLSEGLIGHSIDDGDFEMEVKMPESMGEMTSLAGRKCKVVCSIVAHKRYFDMDEVAKRRGLESEKELENKIKERINAQYEKMHKEQMKTRALDALSNLISDKDVPEKLLAAQTRSMVDNVTKTAEQYNIEPKMFARMFTGEDDLESGAKKLALNSLKLELALRAVAKKEKIETTNEMIKNYRKDLEAKTGNSLEMLSDEQIRSKLLEEKVESIILDRVKFIEVMNKQENETAKPENDENSESVDTQISEDEVENNVEK